MVLEIIRFLGEAQSFVKLNLLHLSLCWMFVCSFCFWIRNVWWCKAWILPWLEHIVLLIICVCIACLKGLLWHVLFCWSLDGCKHIDKVVHDTCFQYMTYYAFIYIIHCFWCTHKSICWHITHDATSYWCMHQFI